MISAWWLLLLIPLWVVSRFSTARECIIGQRKLAMLTRRLLQVANYDRALKLQEMVLGIEDKKQQMRFDEAMKEFMKEG